jgi:hypothetical protein
VLKIVRKLIAIVALLMIAFGSQVAQAGGHEAYRNCRALHRDYEHGVAKNRRAAEAEVDDGYGYPYVSRHLYRLNRDLDANDDGVACEA